MTNTLENIKMEIESLKADVAFREKQKEKSVVRLAETLEDKKNLADACAAIKMYAQRIEFYEKESEAARAQIALLQRLIEA